jgi:hypothetical protein
MANTMANLATFLGGCFCFYTNGNVFDLQILTIALIHVLESSGAFQTNHFLDSIMY